MQLIKSVKKAIIGGIVDMPLMTHVISNTELGEVRQTGWKGNYIRFLNGDEPIDNPNHLAMAPDNTTIHVSWCLAELMATKQNGQWVCVAAHRVH